MAKKTKKTRKNKKRSRPERTVDTELVIEGAASESGTLTITGVPADLQAERIHKLLDLLDLPKGTRVTVSTRASTSIVR